MAINTDAHDREHLRYMRLGVGVARRGWVEKEAVINTLSLKELTIIPNSVRFHPKMDG
ncbi:MAG: hypothetical protein ACLFU9_01700 [Candidatus Bathyarchaeia archaeon]